MNSEQRATRWLFAWNTCCVEGNAFVERIVAGDESWCQNQELESKASIMQCCHPWFSRPIKFKSQSFAKKVVITLFFDYCVHFLLISRIHVSSSVGNSTKKRKIDYDVQLERNVWDNCEMIISHFIITHVPISQMLWRRNYTR